MELLERPDADPAEAAVDGDLLEALAGDAVSSGEAGVPGLDGELLGRFALPCQPSLAVHPRPYQREALERWLRNQGRGVVVLPTGAGKTVLAYMALEQAPVRTLVVVPTIDLLRQWRDGLIAQAGVPADQVGVVGGGERRPRAITVMTYDSAAMPRRA